MENYSLLVLSLIINVFLDALKYEFCVYNSSLAQQTNPRTKQHWKNSAANAPHHLNRLPAIHELTQPHPDTQQVHGKLFRSGGSIYIFLIIFPKYYMFPPFFHDSISFLLLSTVQYHIFLLNFPFSSYLYLSSFFILFSKTLPGKGWGIKRKIYTPGPGSWQTPRQPPCNG